MNYSDETALEYYLAGVDMVISMVSGNDQLLMIDAALKAGVARFVPAEFAGLSDRRPQELDHGQRLARFRLIHNVEEGMNYTLLSCGVLYERFGPGGLTAVNMGHVSERNGEGDFFMSVQNLRAQIPLDSSQRPAMVCMTSGDDVAKFLVAALDNPKWPNQFRMCGQRLNIAEVVRIAEQLRGALSQFLN